MPQTLFQGHVNVYLQGKKALAPFGKLGRDLIRYYVGNSNTRITVRDHRKGPVNAVHQILSGDRNLKFSEQFNQPASITIKRHSRGITVELHDGENQETSDAILWLGVFNDGKMPVHRITWHVFKPVNETSTAFIAIVED
jgi:hypothetical protein